MKKNRYGTRHSELSSRWPGRIGHANAYACKKLFIEANAEMISQVGVNYRIYDLLELSALIEFNKSGFNFILVYGIGKLEIKNGGSFLMFEN